MENKKNVKKVYVDLGAINHFKRLCESNKVEFEECEQYKNYLMKFIIYK